MIEHSEKFYFRNVNITSGPISFLYLTLTFLFSPTSLAYYLFKKWIWNTKGRPNL